MVPLYVTHPKLSETREMDRSQLWISPETREDIDNIRSIYQIKTGKMLSVRNIMIRIVTAIKQNPELILPEILENVPETCVNPVNTQEN